MGALTANRKRCFVDLCFPVPPSSSLDLFHDLSSVSKKLKFSSPLVVNSYESVEEEEEKKKEKKGEVSTAVRLENPTILLPAPPRRRVQGPQRIIRVFGLGNPNVRQEPELQGNFTTMGNLVSRVAKKTQLCSIWRNSSCKGKLPAVDGNEKEKDRSLDEGSAGELKLEDYKRLVEEVDEEKLVASTSKGCVFPRIHEGAISDFRLLGGQIADTPNEHILNRKVDEERSVRVELTPGSDDVRWTKTVSRTPAYKDLLEKTRKYDLRLSSLDFELKLAEEKLDKFHIPKDEKPEEDLLEPFAPLSDEEENDINIALGNPNRSFRWSDILVMHGPSNIEINREKMQCLKRGAWLNDEVINLYLELLKEREKRDPKNFLNCHFFNTFFYKKLTSGRDYYDFKAVRRWTTKRKIGYSLIDCDKIFVPIHKEIHWCLAVINVKEKKFQYLDSLGHMDEVVLAVLARYLSDEVKDKNDDTIDISTWKREFVDGLPLQRNGWDCGMFMLKYTDFYSRGLGLKFSQEHMDYFRRRTVKELLRLRAE